MCRHVQKCAEMCRERQSHVCKTEPCVHTCATTWLQHLIATLDCNTWLQLFQRKHQRNIQDTAIDMLSRNCKTNCKAAAYVLCMLILWKAHLVEGYLQLHCLLLYLRGHRCLRWKVEDGTLGLLLEVDSWMVGCWRLEIGNCKCEMWMNRFGRWHQCNGSLIRASFLPLHQWHPELADGIVFLS